MTTEQELRQTLDSTLAIVRECWALWDNDKDAKLGKLLIALSGSLPGYRPDTDAIHKVVNEYRNNSGELPQRTM